MIRPTRLLLTLALLAGSCASMAQPATPAANKTVDIPPYAQQLMTDKERTEYRARMWAAQNDEERARIRAEHHAQMVERARERGITIPDTPPPMGAGMGPGAGMGAGMGGAGMGAGMGPGSGMGPGTGMGPNGSARPCAAPDATTPCPAQRPHPRLHPHRRMTSPAAPASAAK